LKHKEKVPVQRQGHDESVDEGAMATLGGDPWGPPGNFAGDKKIDVAPVSMRRIRVGDTVKYFGEKAQVVQINPATDYARISAGGKTLNVRLSDLTQLGQGMAEGLSKRDQKDVDAIKAAIERLQAQLNQPNADRDAIQQSIAHERKRLALYGQGVAEGVRDLGYDAQSLIMKLRRDVEEKRLQPTPQAVLAAARELAGDMEFAPQLLVKQVLGQGVAEGVDLDAMRKAAGLPVTEGRILDEGGETLSHIMDRFKHEVDQFEKGGDLDNDLYYALFDYYSDHGEIPYGIAKGRDGDPFEWITDRLDQELGTGNYAPRVSEADALATFEVMSGFDAPVAEGSCNMTAEGEYCPEHALAECGSGMYEMGTVAGSVAPVIGESNNSDALLARIKSLALVR
jgi:hypothetical protein